MSWFDSKKPVPQPELKEFAKPSPAVYLRELRQPLYDTEWCYSYAGLAPVHLFAAPIGQINTRGEVKSEVDTNMTQAGQLPTPVQFDWYQWRMEFSPDVPIDLVRNFRFCSRLEFQWGTESRVWFSVPLSYIPFSATVGIEELRQAVSVLVVEDKRRFEAAWENARIVTPNDIEKLEELAKQNRHEIYRTELAHRLCNHSGRPWRMRSGETFIVRLHTDWDAPLELPKEIAARLYLEGYLYLPV